MTHLKSPIVSIGNYELIYRTNDDYVQTKQSLADTPFLFSILRTFVNIGVFIAFVRVFLHTMTEFGATYNLIAGVLFIILYLSALNVGSFVSLFKVINRKHTQTPTTKSLFGVIDGLFVGILALICGLSFYLVYVDKLSTQSPAIFTLSFFIVVIATPYYVYRLYKLLR